MMGNNFSCKKCVGDASGFPDYKIRKGDGGSMEYWVLFLAVSEIEVTKYSGREEKEKYILQRNSHGPEISEIHKALESRSISAEMYNIILSTWMRKDV